MEGEGGVCMQYGFGKPWRRLPLWAYPIPWAYRYPLGKYPYGKYGI